MTTSMDFWRNTSFLDDVRTRWKEVNWKEQNTFGFFKFHIICFVRPEKKSPNQYTGFFVDFEFFNEHLTYKVGESKKLKPPEIGLLLEGDIPEWEKAFKENNFKVLKIRKKILNSDSLQKTIAGMGVFSPFLMIVLQSLLALNLLAEELRPKDLGIVITNEEFQEAKKEIMEDIQNKKICAKCGADRKGEAKFCVKCGNPF